jgi:predicted AAA+ superfamily ATPase
LVAEQCDATVLTLDDDATRRFAQEDPVAFVDRAPDRLMVIDEAQRVPELIVPLKANVDRNRRPGRFLLTGSADLLQVKGVADSLAGRAETVEMAPLSQAELARAGTPEDFVTWLTAGAGTGPFDAPDPAVIVRGGFPEAHRRTGRRARAWLTAYLDRLAGHDARELHRGGYGDDLVSLMRLVASQGQSELVKAKFARDLGIAESTADVYLRLARTMRLTVEFPAWNRAPRGRIVRRPKICLADTGLGAALARFTAPMATNPGGREYLGALTEQFVALELAKQRAWTETPFDLYHFRDRDGHEVDLLIETWEGDLIAVEVKSTRTITPKLWAGLADFRDRFTDRRITGVLLHAGIESAFLHGWLHVLPITALWQH